MNKPISVAIAEFKTQLERIINDCGIPPVVLEPIMAAYAAAIARIAADQTAAEAKQWADAQNKNEGE